MMLPNAPRRRSLQVAAIVLLVALVAGVVAWRVVRYRFPPAGASSARIPTSSFRDAGEAFAAALAQADAGAIARQAGLDVGDPLVAALINEFGGRPNRIASFRGDEDVPDQGRAWAFILVACGGGQARLVQPFRFQLHWLVLDAWVPQIRESTTPTCPDQQEEP